MKTVFWTQDTPWAEVLTQSAEEDVVVIRGGHAVALLTPFDDDDLSWYARENDPEFIASIAEAREQVRQVLTVSHEELRAELGLEKETVSLELDQILEALDRFHQRATYGAVAGLLGDNPRTLMAGRAKEPRHSWVVRKRGGQPTGYAPGQKHEHLQERREILDDPARLRGWLESPR